jgi:hypothetical protein
VSGEAAEAPGHRRRAASVRAAVHLGAAALVLAAAACAPFGQRPQQHGSVSLPADAVQGAGDPTRAAILNAAYAFGSPAGRPAEAALAVAQLEYLASEIPGGARWREFDPTVGLALRNAREEVRSALGIQAQAPPQAVVDALFGASRALRANDNAAARRILAPPVFPNGAQTLQRLADLPLLPTANQATSRAAFELDRVGRTGGQGGGGAGGGRT